MSRMVDLIVIGGGPAGSTAAAIAARSGLRVKLFEAATHPRQHVGESLLPGIVPILEEMGALGDVEAAGFVEKTGAAYWGWGRRARWDLWFEETDAYDHAWLVDRAEFDHLLLEAARRAGVEVHEASPVRELIWDGDRLVGAEVRTPGGEVERHTASLVVDASGRAALVAKSLGLREHLPGLRHQALWAHFEGAGRLAPPRQRQALLAAQSSHWIWLFPLSDTVTSVGVVLMEGADAAGRGPQERFDALVAAAEDVRAVLGPDARRVSAVRVENDWSYRMSRVAGPGWLLAGDASGFIDPILSTGVMLAMHAGWHAGRTACSVLKDEVDERAAVKAYESGHRALFNDLLRMVRFFYQQNVDVDDIFWESKQVLMTKDLQIHPQKAFLVLTSGLIENLAFDEKRAAVEERRSAVASGQSPTLESRLPEDLGFVCLHLEHRRVEKSVPLYLLLEPTRPGDPALFRTKRWDINCLAPKYGNDPIGQPELAPILRSVHSLVAGLDLVEGETLALFWDRARGPLSELLSGCAPTVEVVRVFGE